MSYKNFEYYDDCLSEQSESSDYIDDLISSNISHESDDDYVPGNYCTDHLEYDSETSQEADSCLYIYWCNPKYKIEKEDDNFSTTAQICYEDQPIIEQESDSLYIKYNIPEKCENDDSSTKAFNNE